jgi:serine/threonine-protein kinase
MIFRKYACLALAFIACALLPSSVRGESAEEWASKAQEACKEGKLDEGVADYNRAIQLNSRVDHYYLERAVAEFRNRDTRSFFNDCDAAIKLNPAYFQGYVLRAMGRDRIGDYTGAVADYSHALSITPSDIAVIYSRGLDRLHINDSAGAISDLSLVIQKNPQKVEPYMARAAGYCLQGNFDAAISDYNTVVGIAPQFPKVYLARGLALPTSSGPRSSITLGRINPPCSIYARPILRWRHDWARTLWERPVFSGF